MKYDCTIKIRFLTTAEGGRKTALNGTDYRAPIVINGKAYEARIYPKPESLPVAPGGSLIAPVKFLNFSLVKSILREGEEVEVLEGKVVARGTVVKVVNSG